MKLNKYTRLIPLDTYILLRNCVIQQLTILVDQNYNITKIQNYCLFFNNIII
jgi:hypothetical protein